jgi:hypothetical protein
MSRNTATRCFRVAASSAALVVVLPFASHAQQQPAQASKAQWSVITVATVKAEMRDQFEAFQKELMMAFKKAEVPSRIVLQPVMGDLLEYVTIYPIANFADLDGPSPAERSLGKDGLASSMAKIAGAVTSVHRSASLDINDLSIHTESKEPAPYAMVMFMRTAPGKGPDFEDWLRNDYIPVMKKAEVKNLSVARDVFGSNPNEYVVVRPMQKLAEIDAGPLARKVLGVEGAKKLTAKTAGIVESVEYRIYRYRADLSYQAPAQNQTTASAR